MFFYFLCFYLQEAKVKQSIWRWITFGEGNAIGNKKSKRRLDKKAKPRQSTDKSLTIYQQATEVPPNEGEVLANS